MEKLNPATDLSLDNLPRLWGGLGRNKRTPAGFYFCTELFGVTYSCAIDLPLESAFLGHFCPHLPQWMHSAASITGKAAGPVLSMRSAPVGQQPDLAQRWQWTHVLRSGLTLQRLHRDVIASMAPNGQI